MAKLTEAQKRQPMKECRGHLSGRIYFEVRVGLQWEVWFSYRDRSPDANGVARWKASSARYWRRINAVRAAADMWQAFYDGVRCESDRVSCDLIGRRALEGTQND